MAPLLGVLSAVALMGSLNDDDDDDDEAHVLFFLF
jgi:hypothetical protein